MRKRDGGSSDSLPDEAASEKLGPLDEAKNLFERTAGEATREAKVAEKRAKSRRPLARFLLALTIAASLLAAATMFYGIYYFPDAPIRQTAGGYVGKGGRPRTQEDFEAFRSWEKAMLVIFPSVFVFGVAFGITDRMQTRKVAVRRE